MPVVVEERMPLCVSGVQQNSVHRDLEIPVTAIVDVTFDLEPTILEPASDHLDNARQVPCTVAGAPDDNAGMASKRCTPSLHRRSAVDGVPNGMLSPRLIAEPQMSRHAVGSGIALPRMHQHAVDGDVEDAEVVDAIVICDLMDSGVREPAPDQLCVPSCRLVEASVVAEANFHADAHIRLRDLVWFGHTPTEVIGLKTSSNQNA
eukprot:TRINITY_DN67282_c0_g1_i1.p1 TRINITY_DN67282_c0_g1~~TRINITY_DN67282_c0_g1_i1.p1  ORF type:complete len:205 (+),score=29.78 TRINITY_DN67282_c0_g1_i1:460-1074(+)